MDIENIPEPEITSIENTEGNVSATDLLLVFGAVALGLFIMGNIMFNVATYKTVSQIKVKQKEQGS